MANVRVLVVDDSAAMRALFCDILDNAKDVVVCGTANNADEAAEKIAELKPDVLTLDVEMPGKSGMDFLAELMEERPMPVIMLSSITQAGTGTAKRAMELGAVHCFPKPLHSSREEFDATVKTLGDIVLKAARGELVASAESSESKESVAYEPSDKLVVIGCPQAGISSLKRVLAAFPVNCPATIVVFDADPATVEREMAGFRGSTACTIEDAMDGQQLVDGRAILAFDPSQHIIVEAGSPARLRMLPRDPVGGFRPSADLLLGSLARAGLPALGGLLVGTGRDGAKGLQILSGAGCETFLQVPADYAPRERYDAVHAQGVDATELKEELLGDWILKATAQATIAKAA
ncbi:MAG: chemotaxis protein CheB [Pseudomonadota bacterium]